MILEIRKLIQSGQLSDVESVKNWLNEEVEIYRSSEPITYAKLSLKFGYETVGLIDETLKKIPGLDWVRIALSTTGLDFSSDEFRSGLSNLIKGGSIKQELGEKLLQLGIINGKRYEKIGYLEIPSDGEIKGILDRATNVEWKEKDVLLCVNNSNIYVRVIQASEIEGVRIHGDDIVSFSGNGINENQTVLVDTIKEALSIYLKTLD